jgi:hypothetical protein
MMCVEDQRPAARPGSRSTWLRPSVPRRSDLHRLPDADFNVVPVSRGRRHRLRWLQRKFHQPTTKTVPIGVGATRKDFVAKWRGTRLGRPAGDQRASRCPGIRARSIPTTSPANACSSSPTPPTPSPPRASRREELGFEVVGLGTYSREFARERARGGRKHGLEALITDNTSKSRRHSGGTAGTGAGHPDGAPHRQAAGHPLRRDLGAGARAGLPGALLAADGPRRRERDLRQLGSPADDGSGRTPAGHVPRGLRIS